MQVTAIQTGKVQIKMRHLAPRFDSRPARIADIIANREWAPPLPITAYLIDHPDGPIVVDTGESSRSNEPGYQPRWHPFIRTSERRWVAPDEEIGPGLRSLGVDPADVRLVVMTHMHGDHAGGLSHFRNAEIVISDVEASMAFARTGPLNGYLNRHYPDWLRPRLISFDGEAWEAFDASVPLTRSGDIRLIPTPGHTPGHMSVAIERRDDVVLLTGDAAYSERALLEGRIDGVAHDAAAHRRSTALLRRLCERRRVVVVPTHDPEGAVRLQQSEATTIGAVA